MKAIKQLLRQPMKTLAGVILITLAVAILCLCLGQTLVLKSYTASLDDVFTTIALPSFAYHSDDGMHMTNTFPEEISRAIKQVVAEHPDVVKSVCSPGLASAYIPGMTMDYAYRYPPIYEDIESSYYSNFCETVYAPRCAMLEVTITYCNEPIYVEELSTYICRWNGIIESTPGVAEGYGDLTGVQVSIICLVNQAVSGIKSVDEIVLEVGQRYLVYTMDFNTQGLKVEDGGLPLSCQVSFTAYHDKISNLGIENIDKYEVPMYVQLEGTVEEFLASEEGIVWQKALDHIAINNYTFPVLGVNDLEHISDFNRCNATITTGRDFTAEELASGAKVCIISNIVAEASGLSTGDTITVRYYQHDENSVYRKSLAEGMGVINPLADYYTAMTPFVNGGEEYTIVGLYTQKNAWCGLIDNLYSFTPNTVFVPKNSVTVEMQYSNQGGFGVLELYNGTIPEFYDIVAKLGYPFLFECYDQGYTVIKQSLESFRSMSNQTMAIGVVVYGIILMLYLVIFPAQQGRTMRLMSAMGTKLRGKCGFILTTGLGVLLPGTILGTTVSLFLWDSTIAALAKAIAVELKLELDLGTIICVAGIQLLFTLMLTLIVSIPALLWNPMKRK